MDDPDLSHAKSTVCTHCSKTFSSKRRLDGHIKSKHSQEDQTYGRKHQCYSTVFNQDAKSKVFSCNICKKHLSSKQRIEDHLYKRHGKSPVTKIYKRWKSDPSAAVPKTTRMRRHQLFSIQDETDTTLDSNDVFEGESGNGDGVESGVENTVGDLAEFSSESENVIQSDISSENGSIWVCNLSDSDSETDYSDSTNSSDNFTLTETASKEMLTYAEAHAYCKVAYGIRHNLSGDASADLTKLMEICSNTSISKFDVTNDRPDYKRVHYCTLCNSLFPTDLEEVICPTDGCHSLRYQGGILSQSLPNRRPMASFILADVQTQLKHVLQRKGMWESIQKTKEHTRRPKTSICDIVDGDCYRNFCRPGQFLDNTNNLSAVFNTDGIPLYNSSKVKLWPIFLAVNEIPVSRRFARENLLLAGIWQGKGNPPFIHYMYAFGEQMNSLYEDGLTIQVAETFVKVKVAVICSTMDLQAKAYVLNMTMHNGEFGCSTCEESGIVVRQGKGHTRCYPYRSLEEKAPLRQSNDIKQNKAHVATLTKKKQMGICGFTGLSVMSCFDLVQ